MTLNRRLLLGFTPVLLILVMTGVYAIFLFSKLGGAIDIILRENYRSVVAAQNMKEAAAGLNAGLLLILAGEENRGKLLFDQSKPIFNDNSDIESKNITIPGEGQLETRVKECYATYQNLCEAFFALAPADPARKSFYLQKLLPAYSNLLSAAEDILKINQEDMVAANNAARQQSRKASSYMIGMLSGSLIIATSAAYLLARSITRPLQNLTESAELMGDGNLNQHVPIRSRDEVGKLATAFNKMATKLKAYRESTTEQVLQAQQVTESALQAFPDPILVFSLEGKVQLQNTAASKFLKLIGGDIGSIAPLGDYVCQSLKGVSDFQPTSFDKALSINLGGTEKFFLPRIIAMRNDQSVVGVVAVLQDVTRFRVADDLKTDLIATVSHELKTPLTSMQMAVYLLLEEKIGPLTPKQTELLLAAKSNSDRLFEMIEDLLDLARFEGGAALIEKKAISCQELIEAVQSREQDLVHSRSLQMQVESEANLPRVEISRVRIDQVFANLISNSVKHAPAGGTITLCARREGAKSVRFSVKDEGSGVPRELHRRVFEKFFRVSENGIEGAGLGLSIAREIVLAHGGSIGVESSPGKGSEFFFILPALI